MSRTLVTGSIHGQSDLTGLQGHECQNQDIRLLLFPDLGQFGYLVIISFHFIESAISSLYVGGRDGSRIHKSNEVLYYPGNYIINGYNIKFPKWLWASERMVLESVWENVIPDGMKELPLPLAGHCVVDIRLNHHRQNIFLVFYHCIVGLEFQ